MPDRPKYVPPITRAEFEEHAEAFDVDLAGAKVTFEPRPKFSTGSFGFHHSGKITLTINNKPVKFQASLTLTVVGSKELAKTPAAP